MRHAGGVVSLVTALIRNDFSRTNVPSRRALPADTG